MPENNTPPINSQTKRPLWTRFLDIAIRTSHVLVISILFGGAVFKIPLDQLAPFRHLAAITGTLLIVSEIFHRPHWPTQIRGLMVFIHAGLLGLVIFIPELALIWLLVALILGMVGSHMPKNIRHWSYVLHRSEE